MNMTVPGIEPGTQQVFYECLLNLAEAWNACGIEEGEEMRKDPPKMFYVKLRY